MSGKLTFIRRKPAIGLALGAGGLRGAAHIGVLQVLLEEGIQPDMISGTSAGSIVAGLYASGLDPDELEKLVRGIRPEELFTIRISPRLLGKMILKIICDWLHLECPKLKGVPAGIIDGRELEALIRKASGGKGFGDLRIPCAIIATDINSGETIIFTGPRWIPDREVRPGTVFITDQPVSVAARASSGIPGIFTPLEVKGRSLVDGGVKDYVPAGILKSMGADAVIAVDLGYAGKRREPVDNILEIVMQASDIMGRELTNVKLSGSADVIIKPRIYDVGLLDFDRIPECIERGREAARASLPEIRRILDSLGREYRDSRARE
ncbi:MAG TPA: patatin-like phospholipase family protein [Firmicutes bacterium]|nr:patatin-like phospholipase family protein [Bacillota bacterium]